MPAYPLYGGGYGPNGYGYQPIPGLRLVGRFLPGEKTPKGDISGQSFGGAPHPHYAILKMPYIDIPNVTITVEEFYEPEFINSFDSAYANIAPSIKSSIKYLIQAEYGYKSKYLMQLSEAPPDDYWPLGPPASFDF